MATCQWCNVGIYEKVSSMEEHRKACPARRGFRHHLATVAVSGAAKTYEPHQASWVAKNAVALADAVLEELEK